jgi:hypothetical protein
MPQDRASGAEASKWGHATAHRIAAKLGAIGMGSSSNECRLNDQRIVIKCAHVGTDSVGVTYRMLGRLDQIVGAFELDDGSFEVWAVTPAQFESTMRESRSRGGIGKTALVSRTYFEQHGKALGRVRI